jgi:hypothetical protein
MTSSVRICGWDRFQHYTDRNPPWIKLYNDLLDNRDYRELGPFSKALLIDLWLLASKNRKEDGCVQMGTETLAWRLRLEATQVREALLSIEAAGFVELVQGDTASDMLAARLQGATPEREGETERDNAFSKEVGEVWEAILTLHEKRKKKKVGPDLQLTRKRQSNIRARLREGFTVGDLIEAAQGFYSDTWPQRDKYLDPSYCFRNDECVRRFIAMHRNGGPSEKGPRPTQRRGFEERARP